MREDEYTARINELDRMMQEKLNKDSHDSSISHKQNTGEAAEDVEDVNQPMAEAAGEMPEQPQEQQDENEIEKDEDLTTEASGMNVIEPDNEVEPERRQKLYDDDLFYDRDLMTEVGEALVAGAKSHEINHLEFFLDYMEVMEDVDVMGEEVKSELVEGEDEILNEEFLNKEGYSQDTVDEELEIFQDIGFVDNRYPESYRHNAKAALFKSEVVDPLLQYVDSEVDEIIEEEEEEIEDNLGDIDLDILEPDANLVSDIDYKNIVGVTQEEYEDITEDRDEDGGIYQGENVELVSNMLGRLFKDVDDEAAGNRAQLLMEYTNNYEVDRAKLADATGYSSKDSTSATLSNIKNYGFLEGSGSQKELTEMGEKAVECLENFYNELEVMENDR